MSAHRPTSRHVFVSGLKLFSGTGAAQLLTLVTVPLLTRLYSTSDFGVFGIFMALTTLVSVLVTGRYEIAIPLPKDDEEGWTVFLLTVALGALACLLGLVVLAAIPSRHFPHIGRELRLLPLSIFFMAGITSSEYWLNRKGIYSWVSISRFLGALVIVGLQLALVPLKLGGKGLIFGFTAGIGLTAMLNYYRSWKTRPATRAGLRVMGGRYRRFPTYMLVAQVCNSASNHIATVFLGTHFGTSITGSYTLGNRAMTMIDLLASAVGQAFYPQIAKSYALGQECYSLLKETVAKLFFFAAVVFPIIFVVAPAAFALVFGAEWRTAGEMVRWVMPMFFTRFVLYPATLMPMITGKQNVYLYRQVGLFLLVASSLGIGWVTNSYRVTLILYSIVYSLCYVFDGYLAVRLVRRTSPATGIIPAGAPAR